MIRTFLVVIFLLTMLPACKEKEQPHLSRKQMTKVMTDIHLAEVYSTMVNDSTHKSVNKNMDSLAVYYKAVLNHHNITMEEFHSSLVWYTKNISELDSVYIDILTEISTLEGVLNVAEQ